MKKNIYIVLLFTLGLVMCINFTACSDDTDDETSWKIDDGDEQLIPEGPASANGKWTMSELSIDSINLKIAVIDINDMLGGGLNKKLEGLLNSALQQYLPNKTMTLQDIETRVKIDKKDDGTYKIYSPLLNKVIESLFKLDPELVNNLATIPLDSINATNDTLMSQNYTRDLLVFAGNNDGLTIPFALDTLSNNMKLLTNATDSLPSFYFLDYKTEDNPQGVKLDQTVLWNLIPEIEAIDFKGLINQNKTQTIYLTMTESSLEFTLDAEGMIAHVNAIVDFNVFYKQDRNNFLLSLVGFYRGWPGTIRLSANLKDWNPNE